MQLIIFIKKKIKRLYYEGIQISITNRAPTMQGGEEGEEGEEANTTTFPLR